MIDQRYDNSWKRHHCRQIVIHRYLSLLLVTDPSQSLNIIAYFYQTLPIIRPTENSQKVIFDCTWSLWKIPKRMTRAHFLLGCPILHHILTESSYLIATLSWVVFLCHFLYYCICWDLRDSLALLTRMALCSLYFCRALG